jgi:predicted GH43/DUF377 family glycosyl hydrolase
MPNFTFSILFIFIIFHFSLAQVTWTKYNNNPVLTPGTGDAWDAGPLQVDAVLQDNGTYHMWYTALKDFSPPASIGYATSTDGINWTKYEDNPVFSPGASATVLLLDSVYRMWYGHIADSGDWIGYASSPDGVNWNIHPGNPVLSPGSEGNWDELGVQQPTVLFDQGKFHMWYQSPQVSGGYNIGYASSEDGLEWDKNDGPVLLLGNPGDWDDAGGLLSPNVIKKDSLFYLYYLANTKFGYATSKDGINWTKYEDNPVISPGDSGSWDESGLASPTLFFDGILFHLWYAGIDNNNNWQIGYATTPLIDAVEEDESENTPLMYSLEQNYPNPFNPITNIEYRIPNSEFVKLSIYSLLGQKVATLVNKKLTAGNHTVQWDASGFSSGIYLYNLETESSFNQSRKLILLK